MKFNQLLHPEVALDKRGPEDCRLTYKTLISQIEAANTKWTLPESFPCMNDSAFIEHLFMIKLFQKFNGKVYHFPADFCQALSKIDREIPIQYLPEKFYGYFNFAPGSIVDDTGEIEGGYVSVGRLKDFPAYIAEHPDTKFIIVSYMNRRASSDGMWEVSRLCVEASQLKISELMKLYPSFDYTPEGLVARGSEVDALRAPTWRLFINALLYLYSWNPALDRLKPSHELSHSQRRKLRAEGKHENECLFPVTLVNWGYMKERVYHIDSTSVQTHMRWQPFGPENSQIKLIWVREHQRKYNKKENTNELCT